jgi:hypothetical protein
MLYLTDKSMIINSTGLPTTAQQAHNKIGIVGDNTYNDTNTLLWLCCVRNFLFHWELFRFPNKTTKNRTS